MASDGSAVEPGEGTGSVSNVIASLRADHANMRQLLDALERELGAAESGGVPDYEVVQAVLDYCLTYPDLYHHPKEDAVYERLRTRRPEVAGALGEIRAQHHELAALTRRLAAAVRHVLQDAEVSRAAFGALVQGFLEHYRRHMDLEEATLFPAAEQALEAADWAMIESTLQRPGDPLFGPEAEARFTALRETIHAWADEAG